MVAGSILFPKFVQLIRNLVLQTNTFSNRQPTKVNLTPTIFDQKMWVFVVAGNIKRHIFIQKQDSQNQKDLRKNQTTNNNQATNNQSAKTASRFILGGANLNNNTKIYRSRRTGREKPRRSGYLIPTWGHLSLANVGRSWAAGAS